MLGVTDRNASRLRAESFVPDPAMCGVSVLISRSSNDGEHVLGDFEHVWDALVAQNAARGPDVQDKHSMTLRDGELKVSFAASVLHMRGPHPQKQPHVSSEGSILCWNGEARPTCARRHSRS